MIYLYIKVGPSDVAVNINFGSLAYLKINSDYCASSISTAVVTPRPVLCRAESLFDFHEHFIVALLSGIITMPRAVS